jgi:hypothetical protein
LRAEAKRKGLHGAEAEVWVTAQLELWRAQQPQRSSGAPIGSPAPKEQVTEASEELFPVDEGYDATSNYKDLNVSTSILEQCLLE